jgi:transcriptional regulator with XRE-family HTH domain
MAARSTPIARQLGPYLRRLRAAKGLTLQQAAPLLDIEFGTLGNFERGRYYPSVELAIKMAEFYEVPPQKLLIRLRRDLSAKYSLELKKRHAAAIAVWKGRSTDEKPSKPAQSTFKFQPDQ